MVWAVREGGGWLGGGCGGGELGNSCVVCFCWGGGRGVCLFCLFESCLLCVLCFPCCVCIVFCQFFLLGGELLGERLIGLYRGAPAMPSLFSILYYLLPEFRFGL